jgi:hypothetical protein
MSHEWRRRAVWGSPVAFVAFVGLVIRMGSGAEAAGGNQGKFSSVCYYSHSAPDDPIVYPGQPGASHMHDFIGNPSTDAFSTYDSLQAAGTNCKIDDDYAPYWAPTLYEGDAPVHPSGVTIYYLSNGKDNVQAYPPGFEELAGNPHAMGPDEADHILWGCSTSAPTLPEAPQCAPNEHLHVRIFFADCWDGVNLDSPDHVSHVSYSDRRTHACDSDHPVPIPMLNILLKYDTPGGPTISLSSGGTYSMHADFINAWDQDALQELIDACLIPGIKCGRP